MRLHRDEDDFEAFRRVMTEAHRRHPLRLLAYCILVDVHAPILRLRLRFCKTIS